MYRYNNAMPLAVYSLLLLCFCSINALYAQSFTQARAVAFQKAAELYVVQDAEAESNLDLVQAVKDAFPDKDVIPMDPYDYNDLKGVNNKFYLTVAENVLVNNTIFSNDNSVKFSMNYLFVQKGKYYNVRRILYPIRISWGELESGIAPVRLNYALKALARIMDDHAVGRDMRLNDKEYRAATYKNDMRNNTLYLRKDKLAPELRSEAAIASLYGNDFKLVTQAQWEAAINNKTPNVIFVEHVYDPWYSGFNVYRAEDGVMIANSFPYKNYPEYTKSLFKRLLK